jgi:hypothetical protein
LPELEDLQFFQLVLEARYILWISGFDLLFEVVDLVDGGGGC